MERNVIPPFCRRAISAACLLDATVLHALGAGPGRRMETLTTWYGRNHPFLVVVGLILPVVAAIVVWHYAYRIELKAFRVPLRAVFFLILALACATRISMWIYPLLIAPY